MTGETEEDLGFLIEPVVFRLVLFVLLVLFLPIYILVGLVPTAALLSIAVQISGPLDAASWLFAGVGLLVCAGVAHALTKLVYGQKPSRQRVIAAVILLTPLIAGALPIYGAAGHGSIQWQNMYSGYSEVVQELRR